MMMRRRSRTTTTTRMTTTTTHPAAVKLAHYNYRSGNSFGITQQLEIHIFYPLSDIWRVRDLIQHTYLGNLAFWINMYVKGWNILTNGHTAGCTELKILVWLNYSFFLESSPCHTPRWLDNI